MLATHSGTLTDGRYGVQLVTLCVAQVGFGEFDGLDVGSRMATFDDNNFVFQVRRGFTHNASRLEKAQVDDHASADALCHASFGIRLGTI